MTNIKLNEINIVIENLNIEKYYFYPAKNNI